MPTRESIVYAAPSGLTVTFGGTSASYIQAGWQGTAEYDGTGRVVQGFRVIVHCRATVYATTAAGLQTQLLSIQQALTQPRGRFTWTATTDGGTTFFDVGPQGSPGATPSNDRRWGPKPRIVGDIQQITGGLNAHVRFEVECFVVACPTGSPQDLEEAWATYSYTQDRNFATTRTVNGQYRYKSALNAAAITLTIGSYFPPLPDGMYRESGNYALSNDGSILTFTCTDKQTWRTLPQPLTDGQATFTLTQTGGKLSKNLSGSFTAPYDKNKNIVMDFIQALIAARFPGANLAAKPSTTATEWITSLSYTNHEFENRIDFSVSSYTSVVQGSDISGGSTGVPAVNLGFGQLGWTDIQTVTNAGSIAWTASSGSATLYSELGTGGLVPVPFDPITLCSTYNPAYDEFYNTNSATVSNRFTTGTPGQTDQSTSTSLWVQNSATQQNAMYTTFVDMWSYMLDRHVTNLSVISTSTNAVDIAQQTALPSLRIVQCGHARRIGGIPAVPAPPFVGGGNGVASAYITKEQITPTAPQFNADGQSSYNEVRWVREVLCTGIRAFENTASAGDPTNVTVIALPLSPIWAGGRTNTAGYGGTNTTGTIQGLIQQADSGAALDGLYTPATNSASH